MNLFNKGAQVEAIPHYAVAINALARAQPGNIGTMNAIRRNLHAMPYQRAFAVRRRGVPANAARCGAVRSKRRARLSQTRLQSS